MKRRWFSACRSSSQSDPYAVLGVHQSASRDEIRRAYFAMAKVHHPDVLQKPLSLQQRDKFHAIVAANDLLSDSHRRAAFDQQSRIGSSHTSSHSSFRGSRFDRFNRRAAPEDPEWDRFYTPSTHAGTATGPRYTSNANFMGLLVFLGTIGAVVQAARLGKASAEITERADKHHFNTARDLAESRRLARDLGKEERKRLFLAHRNGDTQGYGHREVDPDS